MKSIFYDWGGLNVWIFHLINDIHSMLLDKFMLLGTALASHTLFHIYIALFALVAFFGISKEQELSKDRVLFWISPMILFSIAYLLDGLFLDFLKPFLDFPRPPLALPDGSIIVVGTPELHHSFPSGHSSFVMLAVASIWPILQRWQKWIGAFFVLWVGVSRISLGAHFPVDVLGGFITSYFILLLVRKVGIILVDRLAQKRNI